MQSAINSLTNAGIQYEDAVQLRRISMTLHRWHELECGDGNNYASWCLVRGKMTRKQVCDKCGVNLQPSYYRCTECEDLHGYGTKQKPVKVFEYDDNGKPYMEVHPHTADKPSYRPVPDRETGARKRLNRIMAAYPALTAYVQTDPRGCALYIGENLTDSNYNRGIAVYK